MTNKNSKIIWTYTDEAPALATHSFLPIVKAFIKNTGIEVDIEDISLAARILSSFPENLKADQKRKDSLAFLGELVELPEANIIKLPNISASIPQLKSAIEELQQKGFDIPNYPEEPKNQTEIDIKTRYSKCLGSAVNPVLRQGNADRRVAASVKQYAKNHPHKLKDFDKNSGTHVSHMQDGDFFANEKSTVFEKATSVRYEFVDQKGNISVLKEKLQLLDGEVLDATFMSVKKLREFISKQIEETKKQNLLFSLHLKATMMKVSDPVIFGHFVSVFFKEVFDKYASEFETIGVNAELGLADLYTKLQKLPKDKQEQIKSAIEKVMSEQPDIAMVDSEKGITNLHASNLVIIDASMPPLMRDGGKMWDSDGKARDVNAIIPDRTYARFYQETIKFIKENGAFDVSKMGNVSNVGLMAQKAEEYGSHDKTFIAPETGTMRVVDASGNIIFEHNVEKGDIYRSCQAKDIAIKDWVKLAVNRATETGNTAIFWLDKNRAHDAQMITKVQKYLKDYNTESLEIYIMSPEDAMNFTLKRVKEGLDTISVTGNALRDYLTDLFPIFELGTSAKMLSIIPLLAGGGLFETGAGGSAPKHVEQLIEEGHLRWDSLGEFLALTVSLEKYGKFTQNNKALILAKTLDNAVSRVLNNDKSPKRKVKEIDNRGSHFYLALYWAQELANQNEDLQLKSKFEIIAEKLSENETNIINDLNMSQGHFSDIGGYFLVDISKTDAIMRPSKSFNSIIDNK